MGYAEWLAKNASVIELVESLAQTGTWLLPARYQDSELSAEVVYSALSLFQLYNSHVLSTLNKSPSDSAASTETPNNINIESSNPPVVLRRPPRVPKTSEISANDVLFAAENGLGVAQDESSQPVAVQRARTALRVLTSCELLVEIAFERGKKKKWSAIAVLEMAKFAARAVIISRCKRGVVGGDASLAPTDPLPGTRNSTVVYELVHAARPLVYLGALLATLKWGRRNRLARWAPWMASLGVDVLALRVLAPPFTVISEEEKEERLRRVLGWSLYALRYPLYDDVILPRLLRLAGYTPADASPASSSPSAARSPDMIGAASISDSSAPLHSRSAQEWVPPVSPGWIRSSLGTGLSYLDYMAAKYFYTAGSS